MTKVQKCNTLILHGLYVVKVHSVFFWHVQVLSQYSMFFLYLNEENIILLSINTNYITVLRFGLV